MKKENPRSTEVTQDWESLPVGLVPLDAGFVGLRRER